MRPLPAEICAPCVAILDNEPVEVLALTNALRKEGYRVIHCSTPDELFEAISTETVQVLLIDVSLEPVAGTEGLSVGQTCCERHPYCIRVCISQERILRDPSIRALSLLQSLNPDVEQGGIRTFDAFGDKSDGEGVMKLVSHLRGARVCADQVQVCVDEELKGRLDGPFGERLLGSDWDERADLVPEVVEVVKQLARRGSMPAASLIELRLIGKGRSRTLVCSMSVYFGSDPIAPIENIIKIGAPNMIAQEVDRYGKYVTRFVAHGRYPFLSARGQSRNLGGLAYGRLGVGTDNTLLEHYRSGALGDDDAVEVFEKVFGLLVAQDPTSSGPRSLRKAYEDRFRVLGSPEGAREVVTVADRIVAELGELGVCTADDTGVHVFRLRQKPIWSLDAALLRSSVNFVDYVEAVVHGDLHLDNILLPGGPRGDPFMIDFAHTCRQPIFLDPIVMELGCRYQLGVGLLAEDGYDYERACEAIVDLEGQLSGLSKKDPGFGASSAPGRVGRLVRAVRACAARRARGENHLNYLGGLGLAAAACLVIPVDPEHERLTRAWFGVVSLMSFTRCEELRDEVGAEAICDFLWQYDEKQSEDGRIRAAIESRLPALERVLASWLSSEGVARNWTPRASRLARASAQVEQVRNRLEVEYPETARALEAVVERLGVKYSGAIRERLDQVGVLFLLAKTHREITWGRVMANDLRTIAKALQLREE